jgi:hypothetical protein
MATGVGCSGPSGTLPPPKFPNFLTASPFPLPANAFSRNTLLDAQIIQTLSGTSCSFGLTQQMLLNRLQTNFPNSDWTAEELSQRLQIGRRRGRFCLNANQTYVINDNMIALNPSNRVFQSLASQIQPFNLQQTVIEGIQCPFSGNEECDFILS